MKVKRSVGKKFQVRARADRFVLHCNVIDSGGLSDARSVTVDSSVTERIHEAKPDVSEKNIPICGIGFELAWLLPPLMWLRRLRSRRIP